MADETTRGVGWSFWTIGAVSLVWNVMGVLNYLGQMNAEMVAQYPESHRAIIEGRPAWATGAFAIAVLGGSLGSFLLLLKKSVARYLFLASMVATVVTMVHTLGAVGSMFSPFEIVMMAGMPLAVAAFLVWYSKQAKAKGWVQ
jgi:hypothetical protein